MQVVESEDNPMVAAGTSRGTTVTTIGTEDTAFSTTAAADAISGAVGTTAADDTVVGAVGYPQ